MLRRLFEDSFLTTKQELLSNIQREKPKQLPVWDRVKELTLPSDHKSLDAIRTLINFVPTRTLCYEGSGYDLNPLLLLPTPFRAIYIDPIYNRKYARLDIGNFPVGTQPLGFNSNLIESIPSHFEDPLRSVGYQTKKSTSWHRALDNGRQHLVLTDPSGDQSTLDLVGAMVPEHTIDFPPLGIIFTNGISPNFNLINTFPILELGGLIIYENPSHEALGSYQKLIDIGLLELAGQYTTSHNPFRHIFKHYPGEKSSADATTSFCIFRKNRPFGAWQQPNAAGDFSALDGISTPSESNSPRHSGTFSSDSKHIILT